MLGERVTLRLQEKAFCGTPSFQAAGFCTGFIVRG